MTMRSVAVGVVLIAVAATDARLGLSAALLYAIVYTLELGVSLATYFGQESRRELPPRRVDARRRVGRRRGEVRPVARVRAAGVDPDPHRPARHVDQQGSRLPLARLRADDPDRDRPHALEGRRQARPPPDDRRDDLRHRAEPGRGAGPPDEGDRALVPVCRLADALHLGDQHARLHPATAHRARRGRSPVSTSPCGASTRRRRRSP